MAIQIRDSHLEKQIDVERQRRKNATLSKTICELSRERLADLDRQRHESEALENARMTGEGSPESQPIRRASP